jgi:hypothetical protein
MVSDHLDPYRIFRTGLFDQLYEKRWLLQLTILLS